MQVRLTCEMIRHVLERVGGQGFSARWHWKWKLLTNIKYRSYGRGDGWDLYTLTSIVAHWYFVVMSSVISVTLKNGPAITWSQQAWTLLPSLKRGYSVAEGLAQPVGQARLYYGSRVCQGRQARQEVAADSYMDPRDLSERARQHARDENSM